MKADKLFDRWRRRYWRALKCQDTLRRQARRTGDADAVHDLRVAIRRLRLFVRLAAPFIGREAGSDYAAWSRALSKATSAVRDQDVVLEWLATQPDTACLTSRLGARRARLWRAGRPRLRSLPSPVRQHLAGFRTTGKTRRRFSQRYAKRFQRLLGRVRPHLGRYFRMTVDERHVFRRRLRQLRYLRELVLADGKQSQDALLTRLVRPQVAMGDVQNLQLVESLLGPTLNEPPFAGLRTSLARQTLKCEHEIRQGLKALTAGLHGRRGPLIYTSPI